VADVFHPGFVWPERVRQLQAQGVGEEMLAIASEVDPEDPRSTISRLIGGGAPPELARAMGSAHDETMSRSILAFYRSAVPNVSAGWWDDIAGPTQSSGLVLLLPDPPEVEAMSIEVAERLGAETARLEGLNHCWMAEAPEVVAPVLQRFCRHSIDVERGLPRSGPPDPPSGARPARPGAAPGSSPPQGSPPGHRGCLRPLLR
jgi:hypothetical protein